MSVAPSEPEPSQPLARRSTAADPLQPMHTTSLSLESIDPLAVTREPTTPLDRIEHPKSRETSPDRPGAPRDRETAPLLTRAAATLTVDLPGGHTLDDLVRRSAFDHYREGLRQYVAIRLASTQRAEAVLSELKRTFATVDGRTLAEPPGIRAHLYELARRATRSARVDTPSRTQREALPWRPCGKALQPAALASLRHALDEDEAELVELRHARELSPEEIAFVVGAPLEDVLERLDTATQKVQVRLAKMRVDHTLSLREMMLRAFALRGVDDASKGDSQPTPPLPIGTILAGRYELSKRVGRGSFGDVYRARDTQVPGHDVALKILHNPAFSEEARQTSLRELHLIASVFHPSVVQFKDHGWHEGRLWFVMPWYEGETLQARIRRAPLRRDEAVPIFRSLSRALATMHASGIRHQDIKPDNIFLARLRGFGDAEVLPVLLDLGVAAKDAERVVAGTPTYFAPEVAAQFSADRANRPKITPKADLFSLALSLRNALEPSTQPDVPAGAVEAFIERRAVERPASPVGDDLRFLDATWKRWLSVNAEERPTAEEFAEELSVLVAPEERKKRRRAMVRRSLPWLAAVLLVFGSTSAFLYLRAEKQRLEAERAKIAARDLRLDLQDSQRVQASLAASAKVMGEHYAETRRAADQLAARLSGREQEVRRLLTAEERRAADLAQLQLALDGFTHALADREAAIRRASEEIATLQDRVQGAEADLRQERSRRSEAISQMIALRDSLAAVREELGRSERNLESLKTTAASVEARLAAEVSKTERLERSLASTAAAKAKLEAELEAERKRRATRAAETSPRMEGNAVEVETPRTTPAEPGR